MLYLITLIKYNSFKNNIHTFDKRDSLNPNNKMITVKNALIDDEQIVN